MAGCRKREPGDFRKGRKTCLDDRDLSVPKMPCRDLDRDWQFTPTSQVIHSQERHFLWSKVTRTESIQTQKTSPCGAVRAVKCVLKLTKRSIVSQMVSFFLNHACAWQEMRRKTPSTPS